MSKNQTPKINTLGIAQQNLEAAAHEYRLAQAAHEKATQRLTIAEEAHVNAQLALVKEVEAVRNSARVTPLALR